MLELKTIETYYNEQERFFKRNMLREYLQYKILEILYNSSIGYKLSFIDGTSLRIVHCLNRFSEDLDFDSFSLDKEEFTSLSKEIKKKLELEGYNVEIKCVFRGAYRIYVRFLNLLFGEGLSGLKEERLMIQVDSEPHHYEYRPGRFILNKFDVFTTILVTPVDILLSMKISALLNRKRTKARDMYDILFLFGKTEPDYRYLKEKLAIDGKETLKERIMEKLQGIDLNVLSKELEPFMIKKKDMERIILFGDFIRAL
ncbi:MAG: nucleotidyl transferase AbiEii/AbiGii toxin family protein [Acidobacteria bacterium]|jgi:predicted nucleotidyltransferase component of viral defense system|nr:nucleotidyl transferase AbiEii/AbiGii toxin family protein [Acidobacteriota bacterium]